jgi:hypothetical protein
MRPRTITSKHLYNLKFSGRDLLTIPGQHLARHYNDDHGIQINCMQEHLQSTKEAQFQFLMH